MKITCDGLDLSIATAQVTKAMPTKTTSSILEGIKISAKDDTITLSATDLELAIEKTIKADVKEDGETVIPGRFFSEFTKKLTNEKVDLELNENNQLIIKYTDSESLIQCDNPIEFPNLNMDDEGKYFKLSQKDFKALITKTIFATAIDDARPVLKGCCFEIRDKSIKAIALDGYRLAFVKKPLLESTVNKSIVIPTKSLTEICKFIDDTDEEVKVSLINNFMVLEVNNTRILTRLIDGEFINYEQIIPKEFASTLIVNKSVFEEAIDRTAVLSRGDKNNLVKFDIKEKILTLSSTSNIGNIKENIGISLKGNDILIAFNARYFTECLRAIGDEVVKVSFNISSSPCIIIPNEGDEFLYLILPVRILNQD